MHTVVSEKKMQNIKSTAIALGIASSALALPLPMFANSPNESGQEKFSMDSYDLPSAIPGMQPIPAKTGHEHVMASKTNRPFETPFFGGTYHVTCNGDTKVAKWVITFPSADSVRIVKDGNESDYAWGTGYAEMNQPRGQTTGADINHRWDDFRTDAPKESHFFRHYTTIGTANTPLSRSSATRFSALDTTGKCEGEVSYQWERITTVFGRMVQKEKSSCTLCPAI